MNELEKKIIEFVSLRGDKEKIWIDEIIEGVPGLSFSLQDKTTKRNHGFIGRIMTKIGFYSCRGLTRKEQERGVYYTNIKPEPYNKKWAIEYYKQKLEEKEKAFLSSQLPTIFYSSTLMMLLTLYYYRLYYK